MTKLVRDGRDEGPGGPRWRLEFEAVEATLLAALPLQLAALLADPSANRRVVDRLFPPAYADPAEEKEHRKLLGESLLDARRAMLAEITTLLSGGERSRKGRLVLRIVPATLDLLLRFFNDVRLVLATDLGVDGNLDEERVDPSDPDAPRYALLDWLGHLEAILVEAARTT